jgi:hypothetical protein
MAEKAIPWWRRALLLALGGLRSRFGFFTRTATPETVTEPMISSSFRKSSEEERTLVEPSPKVATALMNPAEQAPAAEPVRVPEKAGARANGPQSLP